MIQKRSQRDFCSYGRNFAGDGPGPRCMVPHVKNVAFGFGGSGSYRCRGGKTDGFDPLKDCKYIRLAHDAGLGCGDVRQIEIVGDVDALNENWNFVGPYKKMTFASKCQHLITGTLKSRWNGH